jgi:hypothetical protein
MRHAAWLMVLLALLAVGPSQAAVYNVKVVSDSRPDFTDVKSLLASATGGYTTTDEKCKALWRWLTRTRRQTPEPLLHGTPVHDPIMFYNDFGYSLCSDYAALNNALWHEMGLPVRLWDITAHTVSECFYDGRWHLFDNSMSAYYTLCDGKTVAGVEDVGKPGACAASGGREEVAHIAKYHCVAATSPNGFLSGCDTQRSLQEEGEYVFNTNRLKYRDYYNGFELGHRYQLNLRPAETYTRYAKPLGTTADYYLPLPDGASPQDLGTFGNGEWVYTPDLTKTSTAAEAFGPCTAAFTARGLVAKPGKSAGQVDFLISAANIVTSAKVILTYDIPGAGGQVKVFTRADWSSVYGGRVLDRATAGLKTEEIPLRSVAGTHQYIVSLHVTGGARIRRAEIHTLTQLNKLALPALSLGRNAIDVIEGDPTDAIAVWPNLEKGHFRDSCAGSENVASGEAADWHGCLWLEKPGVGHLTYEVASPGAMTELTYGGRFYNRAPGSSITLEHSFDGGKTWTKQWTLTDTQRPWDTVHFETVKAPPGVTHARVRYTLCSSVAGSFEGCSLYSIRAEAKYHPRNAKFQPLDVTYHWAELHGGKWVERAHTQLITQPQQSYALAVGGEDEPRLTSIAVRPAAPAAKTAYGYSDGVTATTRRPERVRHVWGADLALGKHYTFSTPSGDNWDGGDPELVKLTDGVVASTYGGGTTYRWGPIWKPGDNPEITLDLGAPQTVAAARIHVTGYPYDLYNGPYCTVEVLTSLDGQTFQSQGSFQTKARSVDLDGDFLNQERGGFESLIFPLPLPQPVTARYVRYKVTNPEMFFDTSEVMVYDSVRAEPWREPLMMPLGG